jgi:hypothetical protein
MRIGSEKFFRRFTTHLSVFGWIRPSQGRWSAAIVPPQAVELSSRYWDEVKENLYDFPVFGIAQEHKK